MANTEFPHLFLNQPPDSPNYQNPAGGGGDFELPQRLDRTGHYQRLRQRFDSAWAQAKATNDARSAIELPARSGAYIEFESASGFPLKAISLEVRGSGIRLLNVREIDAENGEKITKATVYIPDGKMRILAEKIRRYGEEDTAKGKPKNKTLVESIETIAVGLLHAMWCDNVNLLPNDDAPVWCEVWLRVAENKELAEINNFFILCQELHIQAQQGQILFPERAVTLIKATKAQLDDLIASCDDLAEFRRAKETADFWVSHDNTDQSEWIENLSERLTFDEDSRSVVCVVDTGVNNGHPLLAPFLHDQDCHTVAPEWGTSDQVGHGTQMCGNTLFGDNLGHWLQNDQNIEIPFKLESSKLIPDANFVGDKRLYGERTGQAIHRAEIVNPDAVRTICMAITSDDDRDRGRPTSWSGALDQIISGTHDGQKRLLIVAAGNVMESQEWVNYPDSNLTNQVHDPAQSWNALTVGAITFKNTISNPEMNNLYTPIAESGQLSPYTTTSLTWDNKWPIKPDIVLEGGNVGYDSNNNFTSELDDLSLLTTNHLPQEALLATNWATSAATALAAEQAGRLRAQYPDAWPETIRGLMVHSAAWTPQLVKQFTRPQDTPKRIKETLLRVSGYGVPNFNRAIASAENSLTLIAEQSIQPFIESGSGYKANNMHLYEMPWPKEALQDLPPETIVIINVTLSYFVEPGPGEIGWRDKYRYRSHGLQFNLNTPTETRDEFALRVNKAIREDGEVYGGPSVPWEIGPQYGRTRGSIHRDWVKLSAADAAETNTIGVFPRSGWWKERAHLNKGESNSRYSLIVSIEVPDIEVDIYSPIASVIAAQIATPPIEV